MYRDSNNRVVSFSPDIQIPAMADGTILNICDDFLGKSVIVSVDTVAYCVKARAVKDEYLSITNNTHTISGTIAVIYSHIHPVRTLKKGIPVKIGQLMGNTSDTSMRTSDIGCHLHISVMAILKSVPTHELNWDLFVRKGQESVQFYNPVHFTMESLSGSHFHKH